MSDEYDAIYDATHNATVDRDREIAAANARQASLEALEAARRPSIIWQPRLSLDGDQWCALYGDDLQESVAGFGDTPEAAMEAFDKAWRGE